MRQGVTYIGIHRRLTIRSSRPHVVASAACFTLRLHASAAPPRVGLTQALALMSEISGNAWKGVPLEFIPQWRRAFSETPAKIHLLSTCPICGQCSLLRWHDGARGLWEWCQSCLSYEHSSALAPAGWVPDLAIQPVGTTVEPTAIIIALKGAGRL